jgi:hypothetical protein
MCKCEDNGGFSCNSCPCEQAEEPHVFLEAKSCKNCEHNLSNITDKYCYLHSIAIPSKRRQLVCKDHKVIK